MTRRLLAVSAWILAMGAGACGDSARAPRGEASDAQGGEGGAGGSGSTPTAEGLCEAALRYKAECRPEIYYDSCRELFPQLDQMDPAAQRVVSTCFRRSCDAASLGACYAEGIAAVEPEWMDADAVSSCVGRETVCSEAVQGDLAACLATADGCDSTFGASHCWNLATLTEERRRAGVACLTTTCEEWESCVESALRID
jgi:hypothetical protein